MNTNATDPRNTENPGYGEDLPVDWPEEKPWVWRALATLDARTGFSAGLTDRFDVILLYHSVGGIDGADYAYDLPVPEFRKQIRYFAESFEPVDLGEIVTEPAAETGKRFAVTFDDGFRNVYESAIPVLREFDVPATVFVCPEFLDDQMVERIREVHALRESAHGIIMSRTQVRELAEDELFTIGNHTASHARLADVDPETVRREVRGGRESLEELIGGPVDRFSYPFGGYDSDVSSVVRSEHRMAVTSRRTLVGPDPDPFVLPRIDACQPFDTLRFDVTDLSYHLRRLASPFVDLET